MVWLQRKLLQNHARIQVFFQAGGGGGTWPTARNEQRIFLSSTYFTVYRGGPMVWLQRKLYFSKDPEGV